VCNCQPPYMCSFRPALTAAQESLDRVVHADLIGDVRGVVLGPAAASVACAVRPDPHPGDHVYQVMTSSSLGLLRVGAPLNGEMPSLAQRVEAQKGIRFPWRGGLRSP
jgi:hypothetical protein